MAYRLAVDLGTTYTAAAVADDSSPTTLGLGNRSLQLPSVVFIQPDGELLVGESAERRGVVEPTRLVREFKRRIGDPVPILVAGSPFSPQALTAALLRGVVEVSVQRMGGPPDEVVLTHPANWGTYKFDLLGQVAAMAGLTSVYRLPEPVAAAVQYAAISHVEVGARFAVYDLGGGTFDSCVLEKTVDGFGLLGVPQGLDHLGGIDFDQSLLQHVLDTVSEQLPEIDSTDPVTLMGLARLRRDCVEAKEALSTDVDAVVPIGVPGLSTSVRVLRAEFEALIRPALKETMAAASRALQSAHMEARELTAFVLVGGSSRIPLVAELLQRQFGVPVGLVLHPTHDIALGAARAESLRSAVALPTTQVGPTDLPRTSHDTGSVLIRLDPAPLPERASSQQAIAGTPEQSIDPNQPPIAVRRSRRVARPPQRVLVGVALLALLAVPIGYLAASRAPSQPADRSAGGKIASPNGSAAPRPLPRSVPLAEDQLIVPAKINGTWGLYAADTRTHIPGRRLTPAAQAASAPSLSTDWATVIYLSGAGANGGSPTLRVAGSDGQDAGVLFDRVPSFCAYGVSRPAIGPAGSGVLALSCAGADGADGLYIVRTDGTLIRELNTGNRRTGDPTFSPDGKELAFWAGPISGFDGGELFIIDADGSNELRPLPRGKLPGQDSEPAWSPDGQSIAFSRRTVDGTTGGNKDIYVVPADSSADPARLTKDPSEEGSPTWSHTGDHIAYTSTSESSSWPGKPRQRVWIMSSDGDDKQPLWTDGPDVLQGAPAWSGR
ncbi:MAG TPA: Hsp70 family protein [Microlunatus sp.]